MPSFAKLYQSLRDQSNPKIQRELLSDYLDQASLEDIAWAITLLCEPRIKRLFSIKELRAIAEKHSDVSQEIFDACVAFTGDATEAISLILPTNSNESDAGLESLMEIHQSLQIMDKQTRAIELPKIWNNLDTDERYILNKLLTNGLKSPVSISLLAKVIAAHYNRDPYLMQIDLLHQKDNYPVDISAITTSQNTPNGWYHPIEFKRAHQAQPAAISLNTENLVSYEWDGVRAQIVKSQDDCLLWTQRGELITQKVPELIQITDHIPPNTRIDGILIATDENTFLPKSFARKRLAKKNLTPKDLSSAPFIFIAIDLFGINGNAIIDEPFSSRLQQLESLFRTFPSNQFIQLNEYASYENPEQLQALLIDAKQYHARAVIIRESHAPYLSDEWLCIKNIPHQINTVLLYVKRGEGAFANEFRQMTLGVYSGSELLPIATCENTLGPDENILLKSFVRENRIDRFGPVISVEAQLVMRIEFEAVEVSKRRKSGVALKKPRIISWEKEKLLEDVSQLEGITVLISS